ncbi:hypothetical protein SLE2022_030940 [Rubroshorea leprosula]
MGRNLTNAVIGILVPLPSILFYLSFLNHFDRNSTSPLWSWCFHHPLLLASQPLLLLLQRQCPLLGHQPFPIQPLDDRFVLDCDPGFAGSLLCNSPSGAVQPVEIHDSDTADMGMEY